jgi:hypothetical protein
MVNSVTATQRSKRAIVVNPGLPSLSAMKLMLIAIISSTARPTP